ncbi:MAG: small acid-soluble spore protein Tlp [Firmicutes bacterium]|nr:small acid-soluble spore protein Tlp [Bacillota bacterium]
MFWKHLSEKGGAFLVSKNSTITKTKPGFGERRNAVADKKRPKPDDRSDNEEKLQEQVVNTIENLEESHETLQMDLPEEQRQALLEKNKRRREAIAGKRKEIQDEWEFRRGQDQQ